MPPQPAVDTTALSGIPELRGRSHLSAQHGRDLEVEVLCGSWSQRPRANRKVPTVRGALREAGSDLTRRRAETGYEAAPIKVRGK